MTQDGRNATKPYRVRAGGTWYWVDPSVPARDIEPGNTVVLYPVSGEPAVAVLQRRPDATRRSASAQMTGVSRSTDATSRRCTLQRSTTCRPEPAWPRPWAQRGISGNRHLQ